MKAGGNEVERKPKPVKSTIDLFSKEASDIIAQIRNDGSDAARNAEQGFAVWNSYVL